VRKGLRQEDVARHAGSGPLISKIEHGSIDSITLKTLLDVSSAVEAILDVRLRWNGEHLDRLLDEAHASLVEIVASLLQSRGWDVAVEVSFAIWGERGSIDLLAFHEPTRTLLVVEIKSAVPDSQATIHGIDRKTRLAPKVAAERGWSARQVARLLVVAATATSRKRVARLSATYDSAFPLRGRDIHRWLRDPVGTMSGLLFVSYGTQRDVRQARTGLQRVRRRRMGAAPT
jgi:transcriptional regulator with XRE-family HTH domain